MPALLSQKELAACLNRSSMYVTAMKSVGFVFDGATYCSLEHALNWLREHPNFRTTAYFAGSPEAAWTTAKPATARKQKAVPTGPNPIWGDDKPLSVPDAAAYADMPLSSFNRLIYARKIASVKIGKRRKVQPSAVRAYIEKQTLTAI